MMRRTIPLLALGSLLGLVFGMLLLGPRAAGEEVPAELRTGPAKPSAAAKDLSRPLIEATRKVRPAVVKIVSRQGPRGLGVSGSGFIISKDGHVLTNRHVLPSDLPSRSRLSNRQSKSWTLIACRSAR